MPDTILGRSVLSKSTYSDSRHRFVRDWSLIMQMGGGGYKRGGRGASNVKGEQKMFKPS